MDKLKSIIMFFILFSLASCSMAPPKQTDKFTHNASQIRTVEIVYRMAQECWARDYSFFGGDGFRVEEKLTSLDGAVISVRRYADDIGYQEPFMLIYLKENGDLTDVTVLEGQCAYGCDLNWTSDVSRWLNGDESCSNE